MNAITNHMPTAELQALDAAHHIHAFRMRRDMIQLSMLPPRLWNFS